MPVKEFSGNATVEIRDGQGTTLSSHALPFSDGRIAAKPKRPGGLPFRELVDGRRKERRADGFYRDVELDWAELSIDAHAVLVGLIDALHLRADADEVYFCPENPVPTGAWDDDFIWRVVPAISGGDIDLIYEDRVRARGASLTLKAHDAITTLPGWFE